MSKLYKCDQELNKNCTKENCYIKGGYCKSTTHKEFKLTILNRIDKFIRKKIGNSPSAYGNDIGLSEGENNGNNI